MDTGIIVTIAIIVCVAITTYLQLEKLKCDMKEMKKTNDLQLEKLKCDMKEMKKTNDLQLEKLKCEIEQLGYDMEAGLDEKQDNNH
jgi:uncharacterized membrane protein (DUF106 family)